MKQTDGKEEMIVDSDNCDHSLSEQFNDSIGDTSDLPTSLIITNIDSRAFTDSAIRVRYCLYFWHKIIDFIDNFQNYFEDTFKKFESSATFQYFKSFRRVRVNYLTALCAAQARIQCHQMRIGDEVINCYFAGVCILLFLFVVHFWLNLFLIPNLYLFDVTKYVSNHLTQVKSFSNCHLLLDQLFILRETIGHYFL